MVRFLEVKKFKKVTGNAKLQYRSYLEYIYDETLKEIKAVKNDVDKKEELEVPFNDISKW